jgi:hypothetical protein
MFSHPACHYHPFSPFLLTPPPSCVRRTTCCHLVLPQRLHAAASRVAHESSSNSSSTATLLQRTFRSARALLNTKQAPRPSSKSTGPSGTGTANANGSGARADADSRTLPIDSGNIQPVLNPNVINATRPPPAPAPAPTSAAAGEASQEPYTGPSLKSISEVKAGDSCVCWTPDWCTCGWQSCPYKPPDRAAALPSDAAQMLFGADVLPHLHLSEDLSEGSSAPQLP